MRYHTARKRGLTNSRIKRLERLLSRYRKGVSLDGFGSSSGGGGASIG